MPCSTLRMPAPPTTKVTIPVRLNAISENTTARSNFKLSERVTSKSAKSCEGDREISARAGSVKGTCGQQVRLNELALN